MGETLDMPKVITLGHIRLELLQALDKIDDMGLPHSTPVSFVHDDNGNVIYDKRVVGHWHMEVQQKGERAEIAVTMNSDEHA